VAVFDPDMERGITDRGRREVSLQEDTKAKVTHCTREEGRVRLSPTNENGTENKYFRGGRVVFRFHGGYAKTHNIKNPRGFLDQKEKDLVGD